MIRPVLAATLLGAVCIVDASTGRSPTTPISVELAIGNPVAAGIFLILGTLLIFFARHCWKLDWKALSYIASILLVMVPVIAFTGPATTFHTITFIAFVAVGVIWLVAYAEADCQRSISILTILLILAALSITFILGVIDSLSFQDYYEHWPVGLFQRGFLLAFGVMALRPPNQVAGHAVEERTDASPPSTTKGSTPCRIADSQGPH